MENFIAVDYHPHRQWYFHLARLSNLGVTTALCLILATAQAEVSVQDDLGRPVILATPAQRIISLSPAATELVHAAGAGKYLIAIDAYSDYPESVLTLPRVGSVGGLDRERLLQLQPDLVIAWASGNKATDLRWLQDIGIPLYHTEPENLDAIALNILDIGTLANTLTTATNAAQQYRDALANTCVGNVDTREIPVFYKIWSRPVITIGGQHWLNEVLQRAGMNNIFADQERSTLTLEAEAALARPYQISVVTPYLWDSSNQHETREIRGNLLLDRPGPRIPEGIAQLCQQLIHRSL